MDTMGTGLGLVLHIGPIRKTRFVFETVISGLQMKDDNWLVKYQDCFETWGVNTVDGNQKSGINSPVEVGDVIYPIIYDGFYDHPKVLSQISADTPSS